MSRGKAAEWIEAAEAARLMSEKHGRKISTDYVRLLGRNGHIRFKAKDKRSKLYLKSDVLAYHVYERHESRKRKLETTESHPGSGVLNGNISP